MLEESAAKPRKFAETIELQIGLQNYSPMTERRFSGIIRLPHPTKLNYKVIVLGDSAHCNEAKQLGVDFMSVDALRSINKNRKIVKKITQSYNAVLSSESLIRQIPRLFGPGLSKVGKFPSSLSHQESLDRKIRALQCSVRFQMKKVQCLAVAVGNVTLNVQQVVSLHFFIF
jgi:large subunit ribosomal protein L10Ae